ncbi:MAG: peptidoglycan bridge formation glycyltransferase FemA/FemB family protein [Pseudomonadota bacterium]
MNNVHALQEFNSVQTIADILAGPKALEPVDFTGISIPEVNYVDSEAWERFAAGYADTVSEQTSTFVEARWGAERTERVIMSRDGEAIGGAVVVLFRVPGTERGLAIVKWGPLWREKSEAIDITRLRACLLALKDEYIDRRGCFLSVLPHADPEFGDAKVAALQSLGFTAGSTLAYPDRYLVNVGLEAGELKASLDQKWRYNLKKSLKNDLEVKFVGAEEGYPVFMELYEQMLGRKQFQDSSAVGTLSQLVECTEETHRPVFVLCYHDGRPTAGAVIGVSGERAVYLYGATDKRALRLKAGYAMHWWIAEWLCAREDVRWYDLGGTDGDKGLHQFKKGFCGKSGEILATPPTYNRSRSALDHMLGQSIYMMRDLKAAASRQIHKARERLAA